MREMREALEVRTVLRTSFIEYALRTECLLGLDSISEEPRDRRDARLVGCGGDTSFTWGFKIYIRWCLRYV